MESNDELTNASGSNSPAHDVVAFHKRPQRANFGAPVKLQTNSFRIVNVNSAIQSVQKYSIAFDPEIPVNSKIQGKVLRSVKEEIIKDFKLYIFCYGNIYTYTLI